MTKFPTHTQATAPSAALPLLEEMQRRFGVALNLFGSMAESPALLEAYVGLSKVFERSALNELHQTIVLLTVSRYHQCHYCMAAHSVGADAAKVPYEITEAIRRHFTQHLVERRGWAEPHEVDELLAAGFSRAQLLDVIVGVALKTLSNYTNHIAGTAVDEALAHRAWAPPGAPALDERGAA